MTNMQITTIIILIILCILYLISILVKLYSDALDKITTKYIFLSSDIQNFINNLKDDDPDKAREFNLEYTKLISEYYQKYSKLYEEDNDNKEEE